MAELKLGPYSPNLGFDPCHLTQEVYRLVCCMAASEKLAKLVSGGEESHVWMALKRYEFSEVCRLLIGLAAAARNSLDAGFNQEIASKEVGIIVPNLRHPDKNVRLNFKDACHKVLHAFVVHPDVLPKDGSEPKTEDPASGLVHLYGENHGNKWHATVNVIMFAAAAYDAC